MASDRDLKGRNMERFGYNSKVKLSGARVSMRLRWWPGKITQMLMSRELEEFRHLFPYSGPTQI